MSSRPLGGAYAWQKALCSRAALSALRNSPCPREFPLSAQSVNCLPQNVPDGADELQLHSMR